MGRPLGSCIHRSLDEGPWKGFNFGQYDSSQLRQGLKGLTAGSCFCQAFSQQLGHIMGFTTQLLSISYFGKSQQPER